MENHRSHDYRHLATRWRRVACACGLKLEPIAESGGFPVYALQAPGRLKEGLYLSAGIHGDEPAGCEGLIVWAERHLAALVGQGNWPLLVLPCLNPWGLVHNRRSDEVGHDLNRLFDREDLPPIRQLKRLIGPRRFALAIHCHEDYDAQGNYLYELHKGAPDWGVDLLSECGRIIPVDPRRRIDGRRFVGGVFLRRQLRNAPEHPEALYLYPKHCSHGLTFETPSEFDLARRVQAQVLLLESCIRRLSTVFHPPPS